VLYITQKISSQICTQWMPFPACPDSSRFYTGKVESYQLVLHGTAVDPLDPNRPNEPGSIACDIKCDVAAGCSGPGPDHCNKCGAKYFTMEDTS